LEYEKGLGQKLFSLSAKKKGRGGKNTQKRVEKKGKKGQD